MHRKQLLALFSLALSLSAQADPVTLGRARTLATRLTPATTEARLVKAAGLTAAQLRRAPMADTAQKPYYIFSRGEGQGYVIVSGDDCLPAILGYTESGDFDEANLAPALAEWLDGYQQLVEQAQAAGTNAPRKATTTAQRKDIAALCQTHWTQGSPYNDQCPYLTGTTNRSITGCVATAATQVVFYHKGELPDTLRYDTPTYGYGDAPVTESFKAGTPLKWDLMQNSYSGSEPSEFRSAVATFMAALGAQTWLTYGSSTSGQISNLVYTFSHQFNLSGTCVYKSGYSQTAWEQLIYDDLAAGKPIVYSGVHATSGGHAVVLDGYQASTGLFHFNFGWGGQSDGWYTVDDQTGMNGFSSQQSMVYGIAPTVRNLEATVKVAGTAAVNHEATAIATVTNHGKLDYSGLMLFANTTGKEPGSSTSAKSTDNATTLAAGVATATELTFKPTSAGTWHLFLTDKSRRILATTTVEAVAAGATVEQASLEIYGSSDTDASGQYNIVYNEKKATGALHVENTSDIDFSGRVQLGVDVSSDNGATFRRLGTKSVTVKAPAGGKADVEFSLLASNSTIPLYTDSLYKVYVDQEETTLGNDDKYVIAADTARFTLRNATLEATLEADGTLTFTGAWDASTFTSLVAKRANRTATAYDLTQVTAMGYVPDVDDKPNALIYVADGSAATGRNVVTASGTCAELRLTAGIDFLPRSGFKAAEGTLTFQGVPGEWQLLTTPLTLEVPRGITARRIDSHKLTGISGCTSEVDTLQAGHTFLVMPATEADTVFTAHNADVASAPAVNADTVVIGTFKADTLAATGYVLNPATNKFEQAAAGNYVAPLGGYILKDSKFYATSFTAHGSQAIDTVYVRLGEAIATCKAALPEYQDLTTTEAYEAMAEAIADAVATYTARSITTRSKVQSYVEDLLTQLSAYKRSLRPGLTGLDEDFTALIVNPSFELSAASTSTLRGWDKGSAVKKQSTASLANTAVGSDGTYVAYCTTTNEGLSYLKQTVKGLIPGTYTLTAMLGTKDDKLATLYSLSGADTLTATVAANKFGQYYMTEARIEGIEVGNDSTLEIGVKPCLWYKADAFKLHCNATAADPSAIETIYGAQPADQPSIRMAGGQLTITTAKATPMAIHNLQGIAVWRQTVDGTATVALPKGLYIVGGKKIIVK